MRSRKGEIGLGRQSSVLSFRLPPRLPASRRCGSPRRASGRAIDIGLPIALFHHSVSPNSHSGDIAAQILGQDLNGPSLEGPSKQQKEDTIGAYRASCMVTYELGGCFGDCCAKAEIIVRSTNMRARFRPCFACFYIGYSRRAKAYSSKSSVSLQNGVTLKHPLQIVMLYRETRLQTLMIRQIY